MAVLDGIVTGDRHAFERLKSQMMSRGSEKIILFTRYPRPGKAKTRLIPALGPEGAADLQRQMTELTWAMVSSSVETAAGRSAEIRYEGGDERDIIDWLGESVAVRPQGGGDLGTRLKTAFDHSFREGNYRVVVVGSDCPGLAAAHIAQAFRGLRACELVIGPANDGGYYLIGLSTFIPQLFEEILWGSEKVLKQTLARASRMGIAPLLLEALDDIDRPEDLSTFSVFD